MQKLKQKYEAEAEVWTSKVSNFLTFWHDKISRTRGSCHAGKLQPRLRASKKRK